MYWSWQDLKRGDWCWKRMIASRILRSGVTWPFRAITRIHPWVKAAEPWGIMLAVIGLFLATVSLWIDYADRVEERTVRAWQLLATDEPGNSGKRAALEYLNRKDGIWCNNSDCFLTLKDKESLRGIDLSVSDGSDGTWLVGADLSGANLSTANLSRAFLEGALLEGALLHRAKLSGAILLFADLTRANLLSANLDGADLTRANLTGAELGGAKLRGADLRGARLQGVIFLLQSQLDEACGDEETKLPVDLTIPMCSEVDWYEDLHSKLLN